MSQVRVFTISIAFIVGIFLASYLKIPVSIFLFLILISGIFFICAILKPKSIFLTIGIAIFVFVLGIFCMQNSINKIKAEPFPNEGRHIILGIVMSEPAMEFQKTSFRISILEVDGRDLKTKALIIVRTEPYNNISYGDKLEVSGILKYPTNFKTQNGDIFPYIRFLEKDKIKGEISYPEIKKLDQNQANKIVSKLIFIKNSFLKNISRIVSEPENSLLGGITIGARDGISKDLEENFIKTGTIHIVALSGYNISIVAESIVKIIALLPFVSVSFSYGIGAISIILFAIMAGLSSTALRATLMALIAILAKTIGRPYLAGRALVLSGVGMLIFNPYLLVFDTSFQLSFLATFALIYFVPIIAHWFNFLTPRFNIRDLVSTTIGIEIFLLPFLIYKFGAFSIISPIANFLILPIIPLAMGFGFMAGLLGFVSGFISLPFGILAQIISKYVIFITNKLASFPLAFIEIHFFSTILLFASYSFLFYLILRKNK